MRESGRCICWNGSWGRIGPDASGEALFVHRTELDLPGCDRWLVWEERVTFERRVGERGVYAAAVRPEGEPEPAIVEPGMRETGVCSVWKGTYGFIQPDAGGMNLFVHQEEIAMQGYRELVAGQQVEFEREKRERGWVAVQVRVVG